MTGTMHDLTAHQQRFARADAVLAGGVSATLRINMAIGHPIYIARADGPYLFDADEQRFIDFNLGNGAALLGHRHPAVQAAMIEAVERGLLTGSETEEHARLAEALVACIPSAERARFSTAGTEAPMLAVRVARAHTGRRRIVKFEGHFHGLYDGFMYNQKVPLATPDAPPTAESAGMIGSADETIVLPWNDAARFVQRIERDGATIAAVICEPINYNSGCIPPAPGFLQLLREVTAAHGIVLIFDEVLSGFRTGIGGAQSYYGVTPDITTLAKALANGAPISATVGSAAVMGAIRPGGAVHSGTYSGNLFGVLAALATLKVLDEPETYPALNANAEWFYREMQGIFDRSHLPARVQGIGARFGLFFGVDPAMPITTYAQAAAHDPALAARFISAALAHGVYIHGYSAAYAPGHAGISLAHTRAVLADALTRLEAAARGSGFGVAFSSNSDPSHGANST
ncbi:MAG: aminotransferase class III-fold pyridoxal phosphate-dependent enzyme [Thermomicrobia bacterium]|nr:aminotransferase class III-fold pyridoxal phosphate-dependent enzyme [Thermomicrobia bacterium]